MPKKVSVGYIFKRKSVQRRHVGLVASRAGDPVFAAKAVARTIVSRSGDSKKAEFVHSVEFAEDGRQTFPLSIV
jgi:hypothetical protein